MTRHIGSRPWIIENLAPGESTFFEVPIDSSAAVLQQQISTDIGRVKMRGKVTQSSMICIDPSAPRSPASVLIRVKRNEE